MIGKRRQHHAVRGNNNTKIVLTLLLVLSNTTLIELRLSISSNNDVSWKALSNAAYTMLYSVSNLRKV